MAVQSELSAKAPRVTTGDEDFRSKFISWNLAELTYVDIREYLKHKDSVLVPMASTEQHGPHLPLYTDTITAVEVSSRVSEHIGVLHTPPIWAGYSPQHMHDPGQGRGTITLRSSTLAPDPGDASASAMASGAPGNATSVGGEDAHDASRKSAASA